MWLPQTIPSGEMLVNLILCGTAIGCWRRSQRLGFLLIAVGYSVLLLLPLIYWLLLPSGGLYFRAFIAPMHFLTLCAFTVLMFRGLVALTEPSPRTIAESSLWPPHPLAWPQDRSAVSRQPLPWPEQWRAIRRAFFSVTGVALLLVVPPVAIMNGSGGGVAIVAAATGLACLWLGLHRGSPLVDQSVEAPPAEPALQPAANILPPGYVLPEGQRVPEGYVLSVSDVPAGGAESGGEQVRSIGQQQAARSAGAECDQPPYPL